MAQALYCLECNVVLGEVGGGDRENPGEWVAVCQTCAQHRPAPSGRPLSPTESTPDGPPDSPIRSSPEPPESMERGPWTAGFMEATAIWERIQMVLAG